MNSRTRPELSNTPNRAIPGVGQRASAVDDFLKYGVEVQNLGDAAPDLAHLGEANTKGLDLLPKGVVLLRGTLSLHVATRQTIPSNEGMRMPPIVPQALAMPADRLESLMEL